ncbi:hypothetical protein D9M69_246690 [compost metagenome]
MRQTGVPPKPHKEILKETAPAPIAAGLSIDRTAAHARAKTRKRFTFAHSLLAPPLDVDVASMRAISNLSNG